MSKEDSSRPRRRSSNLGTTLKSANVVAVILMAGIGAWSFAAPLSGAVIAPGRLIVEGNIKRVQASAGGPVAKLAVKEGERVVAGALLLRLDDTQVRSTLNIVVDEIAKLEAQAARLAAERDGASGIDWLSSSGSLSQGVATAQKEEQRLFQLRLDLHASQLRRLAERKAQLRREADAIASQLDAKTRELKVVATEKRLVDDLYSRGLTTRVRAVALERDMTRHEGDYGSLVAQAARAAAQIAELDQQIAALDQARSSEAQQELRAIERRLEEARERRTTARDQLDRMELRAPVSGIVHELAVPGLGAVLRPGEIAMSIVPDTERLLAEVRIRPQDIDQVRFGQQTRIKFTAFNQRTTPEADGTILRVAADLMNDERTGETYYVASVGIRGDRASQIGDLKLLPGMPAETYILTGERTLASYLLRPLSDQMSRALREN